MKKLLLFLLLLNAATIFPKSYRENFSYFGLTANSVPDSKYPYGGGVSMSAQYSENIFAVMDFTLPGYFDFAPYIGYSEKNYSYEWYAAASPYHYMNIYIGEVSGPGDGLGLSGGYSTHNFTATLTTIALPYTKNTNSFGYINARLAYNLTSGFGVAAQYQVFRYEKSRDPMAVTSAQIFFNF